MNLRKLFLVLTLLLADWGTYTLAEFGLGENFPFLKLLLFPIHGACFIVLLFSIFDRPAKYSISKFVQTVGVVSFVTLLSYLLIPLAGVLNSIFLIAILISAAIINSSVYRKFCLGEKNISVSEYKWKPLLGVLVVSSLAYMLQQQTGIGDFPPMIRDLSNRFFFYPFILIIYFSTKK